MSGHVPEVDRVDFMGANFFCFGAETVTCASRAYLWRISIVTGRSSESTSNGVRDRISSNLAVRDFRILVSTMAKPIYKELQIAPAWVWGLLVSVGLGIPILFSTVLPTSGPQGMSLFQFSATVIGLTLLPMLLFGCFRVLVFPTHLELVFGPIPAVRKRVRLDEIIVSRAETYHPLREYGGWGIKGWGNNWAWSIRGNRGVRLTLPNEHFLMVGSEQPEALEAALKSVAVARPDR